VNYPLWKRIFDITGASVGILIIFPLVPLIILAIKAESFGSAIVRLTRVSEGRSINVYKFRSMIHNAEERKCELLDRNERGDGPFFKMTHDPRVTKVGRVLRKFRIDEFPQLINVLRGELALVGPRPHEPGEVIHYPDEYKHILLIRSGVTGVSQVNGASSLPFLEELNFDKYYAENVSFTHDLKIIGKTIRILFFDPTAV